MTEQEWTEHPYFLKKSETSPVTVSLLKGNVEIVYNVYFRNQLDQKRWEKAQVRIPKNKLAASKGIRIEYFITNGNGIEFATVDPDECPPWFQEITRSCQAKFEKEWKLRMLLNQ
jgi:hypothetical protein